MRPSDPRSDRARPAPRTAELLDAVASRLRACRKARPVVPVCRSRARFAAVVVAALRGGTRLILPPNLQPATIRALGERFDAVIVDDDVGGAPPSVLVPGGDMGLPEVPPHRVVATAFTSGTTRDSRGVVKTAGQLLGEAKALARLFFSENGPARGPVLSTVPPHHIYGLLFSVLVPLAAGVGLADPTPFHPEAVALALQETGARTLVSTPTHLRTLEVLAPGDLPAGLVVFSSGGPLPARTARMLVARFRANVIEVFGSTETGGIAHRRCDGAEGPAWFTPLPGVEVTVQGDRLALVRSAFLPPDAPTPYLCDDRVEMDGTGRFRHLGRADDVVKVGGKRVALSALAAALQAVEGVHDAEVIATEVPGGRGVLLRAAVVATGHDPESLRAALRAHFDPACIPRSFAFVPELPREPTGKLRRAAVSALFERSTSAMSAPRRPPLDLEPIPADSGETLYEAWIPADLPDFEGHFPGEPVLPGVSQLLRLVVPAARRTHPDLGPLQSIGRLRFRSKILPETRVRIRLARRGPTVKFQLDGPQGLHTAGVLRFGGPAEASKPGGA